MRHHFKTPTSLREFDDVVAQSVADKGLAIINDSGHACGIPFTYTIGGHGKNLPELILFGFAGVIGSTLLNALHVKMRDQCQFKHNQLITDFGPQPFLVCTTKVDVSEKFTPLISRFYGVAPDQIWIMQVIPPDADGKFSGDPACQPPFSQFPNLSKQTQ